jgi:hypothetical protein
MTDRALIAALTAVELQLFALSVSFARLEALLAIIPTHKTARNGGENEETRA